MADFDPLLNNRFAQITPDDHSASIWVSAIFCTVCAFIMLLVRFYVKWDVQRKFTSDDVVLGAAQLLEIAQLIAIVFALNYGLGKSLTTLSEQEIARQEKTMVANQILIIMTLALSKASLVLLVKRLLAPGMRIAHRICDVCQLVVVLWGVASAVTIGRGCLFGVTDGTEHCIENSMQWRVVTAYDISTEIMLLLLPIVVVAKLQMSFNNKMLVVASFAPRFFVIAFAIPHLIVVVDAYNSSNVNVNLAAALALQQGEVGYSLISATIPCLKSFVAAFQTGGTAMSVDGSGNRTTWRSKGSQSDSYELGTFAGARRNTAIKISGPITRVVATEKDDSSSKSNDTSKLIIRRNVGWEVSEPDTGYHF